MNYHTITNKSDEKFIEGKKKQRKYASNAELRHDYLVLEKVRIKKNSKITTYYDWHVNKESNKIRTANQ